MKEGSAMTEILAIDDDREILAVIKKALLREGYQVTALEDPLQLEEDKLGRYQLILLDVMMPGIDGFDLCRRIREKVDCPILFLTAKTEEKDVMTGLGAGGDDYITKPFGIGELRARVADDVDMFIVCLNNFFYNSKSQAGSPFIFSPGKVRFIKAVPDFFDTFCRNSDSGIFHGNKNFFIFDACFNLD